ncbi:MAG: PAS domain-containing protein, partial [Myxococcales bacterium]|nr:PAS domain-containing protein [Myxococcales bacterium]
MQIPVNISGTSMRELAELAPDVLFIACALHQDDAPWAPDAVHPEDEPELIREWLAARTAEQPLSCSVRLRSATGDFLRCHVRAVPLRGESGALTGWLATRKALEAAGTPDTLDLLRAVCDTATDAIFVKDRAGHYLYANPRC